MSSKGEKLLNLINQVGNVNLNHNGLFLLSFIFFGGGLSPMASV